MRDYTYLKKYQFKKGRIPHNKGVYPKKTNCLWCNKEFTYTVLEGRNKKTCSKECRYKIVSDKVSSKGQLGYSGLHQWVNRKLGQPDRCEHCGKSGLFKKRIVWANKSGLYKKDIIDWIRLCVPCHHKYDDIHKKLWEARRRKF